MYILIFGFLVDEIKNYILEYFSKLEKYKSYVLLMDSEFNINLDFFNMIYPNLPKFVIYIYGDGKYDKIKFIQNELLVDIISDIIPVYKINSLDTKSYIINCINDILIKHHL